MDNQSLLEKAVPQTRKAFGLGFAVALGVLAATIASGVVMVRSLVREQIVRRDAEAIHATMLMEQLDAVSQGGQDLRSDEQVGFDAALRASRLKGVMGIRFYDVDGVFSDAFPATILPLPLSGREMESVRRLEPCSRFTPSAPLSSVFIYLPQFAEGRIASVPLLEITVPLHRRDTRRLAGVAQFIVEGQGIAVEYAQLDRWLAGVAFATFGVAGTLLAVMMWPLFRRVKALNRDLALRGERLQRANDELALAARASAVGAVSAHLMHGLKNPLASLSEFVSRGKSEDIDPDQGEWRDALTASRRMQAMVEQTLEVLADLRGEPVYDLSVSELFDETGKRVEEQAARRGVDTRFESEGDCILSSRTANLCSLILVNLLENAIEVSPPGSLVSMSASKTAGMLCFRVRDHGPGFPEPLRDQLFLPCKSTHEGGSGIGLAISKQITDHLGARLALEEFSSGGCLFLLELPESACVAQT